MKNCSMCCYLACYSMHCAYLAIPTSFTIADLNMILSLLESSPSVHFVRKQNRSIQAKNMWEGIDVLRTFGKRRLG